MSKKRAPAKEKTEKAPSTRKAAADTAKKMAAKKGDEKPPPKKRAPKKKAVLTAPPVPFDLKRFLIKEAVTWVAGAAVGLTITGGLLWMRAKSDVTAYLADPPRTVPGVIWSAPITIENGQAASMSSIAGDLLAAGYERVTHLSDNHGTQAGEFSVRDDGLDIWTNPMPGVPGGLVKLRIDDGRVVSGAPAVLRPTVLATIGEWDGRRAEIDLKHLAEHVEPALLAMEDQRFREHSGVDPWGVARAVLQHAVGSGEAGGSTLTQQLAKNLFLSSERTLRRKVREVFFAAALESELSKDELLELYLEEVYLGQMGGIPLYGIESAARAWFGKSAESLALHEVATIIGVIPAPNRYNPRRHPEKAEERRNIVLDQMARVGAISRDRSDTAKQQALVLHGALPGAIRRAPWAVDYAVDHAERHVGEGALASRGYHVHTSIQPLLQRAAEGAVAEGMAELDAEYPKAAGAQVALVAVRVSDGAIVAMVGSRNYAESPYNRAVNAWRQAGSTVKPFTMLAAFDRDPSLTPVSTVRDEPITRRIDGKTWTPQNYDNAFLGEITLRKAMETSRNIPAITLAEDVGPERLQSFMRDAGLSHATNLPSAALGGFEVTPLELATAYTAFPGGGTVQRSWVVDSIAEPSGEVVLDLKPEHHDLATARAATLATTVLHGVIERGTASRAKQYGISGRVGGKTGTTSDYRDAWFVGFTDELAVAVWVGRDRGEVGLSGSRAALPTWARFVSATGTIERQAALPDGLVSVEVCAESSLPARPECTATYSETFPEDAIPTKKCDLHGGPLVDVGRALGKLFRPDR
ncbi:MAG: transglycosylase domain-containing protein [Alphaproteobacteria bacterium]|nr:transglycosylase domain-containing protein [Alphaproteobacteria bacterium]